MNALFLENDGKWVQWQNLQQQCKINQRKPKHLSSQGIQMKITECKLFSGSERPERTSDDPVN